MDLLGRAKKWVKGMAPAEPAEPQPFRVACPAGHLIRGRRSEGYQALRCPECGAGVFVLPRSPLPMPPMPASRAPEAPLGAAGDDAPIPLVDHVPESFEDEGELEWLEPVGPEAGGPPPIPGYDPVEAAVSELPPDDVPEPPRRPAAARPPRGEPIARPRPAPAPAIGPRILVAARPTFGQRLRRNRPMLVGLAVVGVLLGTIAWSIVRNQRRDDPGLVQLGRDEGIPALDRGDFDRAHRLLSRASVAVERLGGQIGGAEEVRQAAREAAIFADLVPERLEAILDRRARTSDEAEWQSRFDREYKGRSILVSAEVTGSPSGSAGRFDVNYRILELGPNRPRRARIDFEGFRLFEAGAPEVGSQVQFGARLAAVDSDPDDLDGWRFRLEPGSGVTITHVDALRALGWAPVETAALAPSAPAFSPALLATLLAPAPPPLQDLKDQTRDRVLEVLGAPRSFARSASQGESVEQWIYDGPTGTRQFINFLHSAGRSGPSVVERQFVLPR